MAIIPQANDIMCGKDKDSLNAQGSRWFRTVIDTYADRYQLATSKYDKMTLTRKIYEEVKESSSRFLKYNFKTGEWEELSVMSARDKIGHSLRFAARATRRFKKAKNGIKRSGSASSLSSNASLSSSSSLDSSASSCIAIAPPAPVSSSCMGLTCMNEFNQFLALEAQFSAMECTAATATKSTSNDDEEDTIFMNSLMSMLQAGNIRDQQQKEQQDNNMLSLLIEPVGEWEDESASDLSNFVW